MPIYEYECERHGAFEANRPLRESAAPQSCPDCGAVSARVILSFAALSRVTHETRTAHQRNERSAHEPTSSRQHQHGKGCGCGSSGIGTTKTLGARNGAKAFPNKRPWMISH